MVSRKYVFVIFLILLIILPIPGFSKDNRGIAVTSPGQPHGAGWGNYHALIIGINAYKEWNPLQTAAKDAEGWYEILTKRYGFAKKNVILRTDSEATLDQIMSDLRSLATNLESSDNLLIYFAGHGQLDDITGDGYWIPVEGKLKKPSTWISQYRIKSILSSEKIKGKNIVVVADSCYSGSMLRGGTPLLPLDNYGYQMRIEKAAARRSRQVITSGGIEPVADGGRDGHSLFAYYFLKALKENNREVIDIENLFHTGVWKYVTEIGDQRPTVGRLKTPMDDDGQFVLIDHGSIARKLEIQARDRQDREQLQTLMLEKQKLEKEALEAERRRLEAEMRLKAAKQALEVKLKRVREESASEDKTDGKVKELESQLMAYKAKMSKEVADRKALEEKLKKEVLEAERRRREAEQLLLEQKDKMKAALAMGKRPAAVPGIEPLKLAIFPWRISLFREDASFFVDNLIPVSIEAALTVTEKHDDIKLKYSYYTTKLLTYNRIDSRHLKQVISKKEWEKVWHKKSFFAAKEPHIDTAVAYGDKVGADLALMMDFKINQRGPADVNAYLLDIKNKNIYKLNREVRWDYVSTNGDEIEACIDQIVNTFVQERKTNN